VQNISEEDKEETQAESHSIRQPEKSILKNPSNQKKNQDNFYTGKSPAQ
jgi:hypothetical protein